jgi:hypothetical protein
MPFLIPQSNSRGPAMSSSFKNPYQKPRQFSRSGTFADLLMRHVRAKGGDAPAVYTAARIDRRTYSSIISHPFRQVSKRTAVQFALALRLDRKAADELLLAVGFALSPVIPEDVVFAEAIAEGNGDLRSVSERLYEQGMRAIV